MSNESGNSCSGPKRRRSSARLDSEQLPERSFPSLDSAIETVLRKAVRQRMDADKAHSSLLSRVKRLEEHLSKDTIPNGLRIASIQAKGTNVETLQANFDEIVQVVIELAVPAHFFKSISNKKSSPLFQIHIKQKIQRTFPNPFQT